jgi:hypothetical protein
MVNGGNDSSLNLRLNLRLNLNFKHKALINN